MKKVSTHIHKNIKLENYKKVKIMQKYAVGAMGFVIIPTVMTVFDTYI